MTKGYQYSYCTLELMYFLTTSYTGKGKFLSSSLLLRLYLMLYMQQLL
jgi:hypothetical protein